MRPTLAASLLLLASPCLGSGTFSDLRTAHASVDPAISRLPSNGVNGTLSHISSLLAQRRVAPLGPGQVDQLPSGFTRQMGAALDRLATDLEGGLPGIEIMDRLVIAQVVGEVAIERNADFFGDVGAPCDTCVGDPDEALALVVDVLATSIRDGVIDYARRNDLDLSSAWAAANAPVTPRTFGDWLRPVVDHCAILGVEHIDH